MQHNSIMYYRVCLNYQKCVHYYVLSMNADFFKYGPTTIHFGLISVLKMHHVVFITF